MTVKKEGDKREQKKRFPPPTINLLTGEKNPKKGKKRN